MQDVVHVVADRHVHVVFLGDEVHGLRRVIALDDLSDVGDRLLDRLARRAYDLIALLEEFEKAGVSVHLAQQINPPNGAQARFVRHLLGVFAEFEREMIATRIAETRAYLKHHGRRIAGPAPYGYAPDPVTKQLVVIPKEARRVRLIFQRAAAGQTPSEIASRINHFKWRTKTWVSRRSNRQRGGGKWTARQVIDLLRNPVYIGRHRDPTGSRPGSHDSIVNEALFTKVQDLLTERRTVSNPKRQRMTGQGSLIGSARTSRALPPLRPPVSRPAPPLGSRAPRRRRSRSIPARRRIARPPSR